MREGHSWGQFRGTNMPQYRGGKWSDAMLAILLRMYRHHLGSDLVIDTYIQHRHLAWLPPHSRHRKYAGLGRKRRREQDYDLFPDLPQKIENRANEKEPRVDIKSKIIFNSLSF